MEYITFWESENDSGIYEAMNKGIRVAKGEYCQFLNSGDWLVNANVTEQMLAALPAGSAIFYGNMLKPLKNGRIYRDTCDNGNITLLTFFKGSLNHAPAYIRRDLFDRYGLYDESLRIVSDWKWYLQAVGLNNEPVHYIDLDVAYFDMNGISSRQSAVEKEERERVLKELVPDPIRIDYEEMLLEFDRVRRINRYSVLKWLFHLADRVMFKVERLTRNDIIGK